MKTKGKAVKKRFFVKRPNGSIEFNSERELKDFVHSIVDKEIDAQTPTVLQKAVAESAGALFFITVTALQDTFGFGLTRLTRYRDRFEQVLSDVYDGKITIQEMTEYFQAGDFKTPRLSEEAKEKIRRVTEKESWKGMEL